MIGIGIGTGIRERTGLHAIVFDFDGVIADSERLHLRSYQDILAPEGITMSNEDYFNRYLGYDDVGVFKAVGRDQGVAMDEHRVSELIARKGRALRIARRGRRDAVSGRRRLHSIGGRGIGADRDRIGRADARDRGRARARRPARPSSR